MESEPKCNIFISVKLVHSYSYIVLFNLSIPLILPEVISLMSDPTVSLMPGSHATSYSNISLQNILTKLNLIHGAKTEFTHAKTKIAAGTEIKASEK